MVDKNSMETPQSELKQDLEKICNEIQAENASSKQKAFSELWKRYVNENDYDDFAEETLIRAYQCNSINYWKDLWKKAQEFGNGDLFFEKFLSGKKIKNKGPGQLIIVLGALSICIDEFKIAGKYINPILDLLNGLVPRKDDNFDIKEYDIRFLKRIKIKNDDIEISSIKKAPREVFKFLRKMEKYYPDKDLDAEGKAKLEFLISILTGQKKKEEKEIPSNPQKLKEGSSEENTTNQTFQEELKKLKKTAADLRDSKQKLERELEEYRSFFKHEKEDWQREKKDYEKQLKAFQNSLENRRSEITGLKNEIQNLNNQTKLLSQKLSEKEEIIRDKDEGIRILRESHDDRFEEKMKSIYNQLIVFYAPFQMCSQEEMSLELGEAMRTYLESVFNIIINNGINLNQQ